MPTTEHARWGQIEVQAHGEELLKSPLRGKGVLRQKSRYTWRPCAEVAEHVGPSFAIEMDCYLDGEGRRRFTPAGSSWYFINMAYQAGRTIRSHRDYLSHEEQVKIEVLWNCYQRLQRTHDKLKRKFKTLADLQIRRGGREHDSDTTILPEGLGSTPNQPDFTWTLPELIEQGRRRAELDGVSKLNNAVRIQYGLLAAAEQNPLPTADRESEAVIRMALLDIERATDVPSELVDCLFNRLKRAFGQHENDSSQKFWTWFNGNVFKALANQAGDTYGKLDLAQVRSAALEIGWRAHHTVANCIATFAEVFAADLPEPLTAEEQALFAANFYPQAFLGGLPLTMVLDRSELIQPVITRMWDKPDNAELPGVLLRLLQFYAEMISKRRAADRRTKETAAGKGHLTVGFPLGKSNAIEERAGGIADLFASKESSAGLTDWKCMLEKLRIACPHANCLVLPRLTGYEQTSEGVFLDTHCEIHGALPRRPVSTEMLNKADPFDES